MKKKSKEEIAALAPKVHEMASKDVSQREIAKELDLGLSTVQRILNKPKPRTYKPRRSVPLLAAPVEVLQRQGQVLIVAGDSDVIAGCLAAITHAIGGR